MGLLLTPERLLLEKIMVDVGTGVGDDVGEGDGDGVGVGVVIVVLPRFRLLTWTGVFLSLVVPSPN